MEVWREIEGEKNRGRRGGDDVKQIASQQSNQNNSGERYESSRHGVPSE